MNVLNPSDRRVLVLGAHGRFGQAACDAFAAAGWTVLAQARRMPTSALAASTRHVGGSLDAPDAVASISAAARGASVVVYAANPLYTRWPTEALPMARAGMDIAERLGAVFMLPGNVYNYGTALPARLTEDTPMRPDHVKARIRCAMEDELAARAPRLRSVVLRAGDFFGGRGPGTWLDQAIAKSVLKGRWVYPGPLDLPHAWAYLPDLARAFVALAEHEGLPPATRLHFEGHTLTGAQLLDGLQRAADELGLRPARGWQRAGFPWPLLRLAGLVMPMLRALAEMAYLWRLPHALDGTHLRETVGALPATPLVPALRDALLQIAGVAEAARNGAIVAA